jgi:hypothetical protein
MVAFCFELTSETWAASAGIVPVNSGASVAAGVDSGEEVGAASGVAVLASAIVRGGRPWTAEALLNRAMTLGEGWAGSFEGVDLDDSADDVCVSTPRPWELAVGAEV